MPFNLPENLRNSVDRLKEKLQKKKHPDEENPDAEDYIPGDEGDSGKTEDSPENIPAKVDDPFTRINHDEARLDDPSLNENPDSGDMLAGDEEDEANKAKMLKNRHILMAVGGIGVVAVCGMIGNIMFRDPPKNKEDAHLPQTNMAGNPDMTPAGDLPDKYSDIAKYSQKKAAGGNQGSHKVPTNGNAKPATGNTPVRYTSPQPRQQTQTQTAARQSAPARSSGSYRSSSSSSSRVSEADRAAEQAAKKRQQEEQSAIESAIAFMTGKNVSANTADAVSAGASANGTPTPVTVENNTSGYSTQSYSLYAGSVIQATLLTGVTSDMGNGDVVAQVRQNIYDSDTGEHLLIPQGSKLVGKYGSAGSRGNARIGVAFSRIILPSGESIALPDQKAIDGIGFPGLKDQYTEHTGKMFAATFMSALIAAAAQSASGNSSGDDTRSPGQEAVSGAVADVLDSTKEIIDRAASVQPTITIRPGFEFSVFINKDLSIPEYIPEYGSPEDEPY